MSKNLERLEFPAVYSALHENEISLQRIERSANDQSRLRWGSVVVVVGVATAMFHDWRFHNRRSAIVSGATEISLRIESLSLKSLKNKLKSLKIKN